MLKQTNQEMIFQLILVFLLLDRMCECSVQSPASCLPDCECRPLNQGDTRSIEMNCMHGEYSDVPNPLVRARGDEKSPPDVISLNLANNSVAHLKMIFGVKKIYGAPLVAAQNFRVQKCDILEN
jgi:hypothetical protein